MATVVDSGFTPTPSSAGSYRLPTDRNSGSASVQLVAPLNSHPSIYSNLAVGTSLENESVDVGPLMQPYVPPQEPNSGPPAQGRMMRADHFGSEPLFDPVRDAGWVASGVGARPLSEASSVFGSHHSAARVVQPQEVSPSSSSPPLVFQTQPLVTQPQFTSRLPTPRDQPTSFSLPNLNDQSQFSALQPQQMAESLQLLSGTNAPAIVMLGSNAVMMPAATATPTPISTLQRSIDVPLQLLQAPIAEPLAPIALSPPASPQAEAVGRSVTPRVDLNRFHVQLRSLTQIQAQTAATVRRPPLDSNQLPELVELLRHPAETVRLHSALFLQHLFFEQEKTKAKFLALDGMRYLLELLRSPAPDLLHAALGALRNLSSTKNDEIKVCSAFVLMFFPSTNEETSRTD